MKSLVLIFLIFSANQIKAEGTANYKIINQTTDASITGDSIYVFGKVNYNNPPPLNSFGKIASLDFKVATIVERSGNFTIKLKREGKGIYFFQEGYKEVVVNLSSYPSANSFEVSITTHQFFALDQVEKPVVYLYSVKPISTTITLNPVGNLAFTYPDYDQNWSVETQPNGDIKNLKTGKLHPYLFWEANQIQKNFLLTNSGIEGFIVKTDTVISFLENQLEELGLSATESTDFITYWAPRLQVKEYAVVQFLVGPDYTAVFGGIVSSTPLDYELHIGMLFEVSEVMPSLKINEPKSASVKKRHGFSLIEWGGIELKNALISL